MKKVIIVDYGMGNLWSVESALRYLGCDPLITDDISVIEKAKHLILPGVGSFRLAMQKLKDGAIDKAILNSIKDRDTRLLGICLGMQLLGQSSDEDGFTEGLKIIPIKFNTFKNEKNNPKIKIPHVGFNSVNFESDFKLFNGLEKNSEFYFVHSFRAKYDGVHKDSDLIYSTCDYSSKFIAAYSYGNVFGTQFHPEKSQTNGLIVLDNFINQKIC